MMSLCADIQYISQSTSVTFPSSNSELVKQVKLKFKWKKCDLSD